MSSVPDRYRPTVVEIDLGAFERNARAVAARLPGGSRLIAVLKADAYGHGAVRLAKACEHLPVAMIAVALVEEALELQRAGVTKPILLIGPLSPGEGVAAVAHGIVVGVSAPDALDALRVHVADGKSEAHVHLKLDTGMGRLGLVDDELESVARVLRSAPRLRVEAVYTHFASASNADDPLVAERKEFQRMVARLRDLGIDAPLHHAANSAALMRNLVAPGDYVRVGLALYGGEALERGTSRLEPVMRWSTRVTRVKCLPANRPVGYGATWRSTRPARIATVPVGYADGLDRLLSNRGEVLVHGRRAPIVGRVSMDITTIDVTEIDSVAVGDEVVLLGRQGDLEIAAEEIAATLETIPYEIFCRIGPRVPRILRTESEGG